MTRRGDATVMIGDHVDQNLLLQNEDVVTEDEKLQGNILDQVKLGQCDKNIITPTFLTKVKTC